MRKNLLTLLVFAFALFLIGTNVYAADVAVLISDYTKTWYEEVSWDFTADMDTIRDLLDVMGVNYVEISDSQLASGDFDAKLLILPNNRRMSREQVKVTREFLKNGGTLFALMQSSFKDENNETVDGSLYQLKGELGIEAYEGFGWKPPAHGYIKKVQDHPIFEGLPEFIKMYRNWAMINRAAANARVLGEWYNNDKMMPSHLPELNAAIIENAEGNVIYVGEMLFMEDHMADPNVRTLVMNIINYLLDKAE